MIFFFCCFINLIKLWFIIFFVIKIIYVFIYVECFFGCVDKYSVYIFCYFGNVIFINIIDIRGKNVKFIFNFIYCRYMNIIVKIVCFVCILEFYVWLVFIWNVIFSVININGK